MVAPIKSRRFVCTIVRLATDELQGDDLGAVAERIAERSHHYAADPFVAGLVRRLKSEVRAERSEHRGDSVVASPANRIGRLFAELEPPSPAFDSDWEWRETPRWSFDDAPPSDESFWWD